MNIWGSHISIFCGLAQNTVYLNLGQVMEILRVMLLKEKNFSFLILLFS